MGRLVATATAMAAAVAAAAIRSIFFIAETLALP
jgi:hypothetical protein